MVLRCAKQSVVKIRKLPGKWTKFSTIDWLAQYMKLTVAFHSSIFLENRFAILASPGTTSAMLTYFMIFC